MVGVGASEADVEKHHTGVNGKFHLREKRHSVGRWPCPGEGGEEHLLLRIPLWLAARPHTTDGTWIMGARTDYEDGGGGGGGG